MIRVISHGRCDERSGVYDEGYGANPSAPRRSSASRAEKPFSALPRAMKLSSAPSEACSWFDTGRAGALPAAPTDRRAGLRAHEMHSAHRPLPASRPRRLPGRMAADRSHPQPPQALARRPCSGRHGDPQAAGRLTRQATTAPTPPQPRRSVHFRHRERKPPLRGFVQQPQISISCSLQPARTTAGLISSRAHPARK